MLSVGLGYLDLAAAAVVFLVLTPLIVSHLGTGTYAVWVLSHTIAAYLRMLDLGVGDTHVRFLARFAAAGRSRSLDELTATVGVVSLVAAATAGAIGIGIALAPSEWLDTSAAHRAELRVVLLILACQVFVAIPATLLDNVYEGLHRFDVQHARSIVLRLLSAGAQLALLQAGYGVVALVIVELAVTCLRMLTDVALVTRLMPSLLRVPLAFHPRLWRRIKRYTIWSSADDLVAEGASHIDDILLAALLPLTLLTPYSIAATVSSALMMAVQPITATFYPLASSLQSRRDAASIANLITRGTVAVAAVALPLAVLAALFGHQIIRLWIPEAAADTSPLLLTLLASSGFISAFLWTGWIVLAATGRIRIVVQLLIAEVIVESLLIVLMAPRLGLIGLALAEIVANVSIGLCFELPLVARLARMTTTQFLRRTLGPLAAAGAAMILAALAIRILGVPVSIVEMIATAAALFAVYCMFVALLSTRAEREEYLSIWRTLRESGDAADARVHGDVP